MRLRRKGGVGLSGGVGVKMAAIIFYQRRQRWLAAA